MLLKLTPSELVVGRGQMESLRLFSLLYKMVVTKNIYLFLRRKKNQ